MLLAPHISNPDNRHLTCIRADNPYARLMRAHMFAIFQTASRMTMEQGNLLAQPTVSLLAAVLNGSPSENEGGEEALQLAVITTIRKHIDDCLDDPDLNADRISDIFGISRTRLYKFFQSSDGIASYIRNRRLAVALGILSDPTQRRRKIIDIALSVGFASKVSFIRAFRRRYGLTPSEARNDGLPPVLYETDPGSYAVGDRYWEGWLREI